MKEVLYYNSQTKELHLKMPEVKKDLLESLIFTAWFYHLDHAEIAKEKEKVEKASHKSIRLLDGDEFDLEYGYALLRLEAMAGSKRQRNLYLKRRYGSLLTPESEKVLTITAAMNHLGLNHDQFKEHVHEIYSNEKLPNYVPGIE